ncbi:MAG: AMP-binding protein, partial [bacterium]|nr:AMP-binding protein [bacterium]
MTTNLSGAEAIAATQKKKEREYWLEKMSGELSESSLPVDFKKTAAKEYTPAKIKFDIGDTYTPLMKLINNSDARLHMVLTAVLGILLKKYTDTDDIVLGTTIFKQEDKKTFVNTVLPLRNNIPDETTFKELLLQVRKTIYEAVENQNFPINKLPHLLGITASSHYFPLFDSALLLTNVHKKSYIEKIKLKTLFFFTRIVGTVEGGIEYDSALYRKATIERIAGHFNRILQQILENINIPITDIELLTAEEKEKLITRFNKNETGYEKEKNINELFEEQVSKAPHKAALQYQNEILTYKQLNGRADRIAGFLKIGKNTAGEEPVGVLMDRSTDLITAIMGILKAGCAYVPIVPALPEKRMIQMIDDGEIGIVITAKKYIRELNRLQWECKTLHSFLCLDSSEIDREKERQKNELMDEKLWEYIGESASDDITGGGWFTSYTGEAFSKKEMDEYGENILEKIRPVLHKKMRVLEIGCASGLSMYRIAPEVGYYYGTDLSKVIVEKNKERVKNEGHTNIQLTALPAHEIDKIEDKNFDLIIMNSVLQSFHGHNYLRDVVRKAVGILAPEGYFFIGDIMDRELKKNLEEEMLEFKRRNRGKNYKTKTDWSGELFISRRFLEDLTREIPGIKDVQFSEKIHTIENELTKFRYDAMLTIDKNHEPGEKLKTKNKYRSDLRDLQQYGTAKPALKVNAANLAYIIYTSGTTGKPKGV